MPGAAQFVKAGWSGVIAVDGTFNKHVKSTLMPSTWLTAATYDANQQRFLIAAALVTRENQDNWQWFLHCLKESCPGWTVLVSDWMAGLRATDTINLLEDLSIKAVRCAFHAYGNYKRWLVKQPVPEDAASKEDAITLTEWTTLVQAPTKNAFQNAKDVLLKKHPLTRQWINSNREHLVLTDVLDSQAFRLGFVTSNVVEGVFLSLCACFVFFFAISHSPFLPFLFLHYCLFRD